MNPILVALDGSPRAQAVLDFAANFAHKMGTTLVLFRAVGIPAELPAELWKHPEESLIDMLREGATAYLTESAKRLPREVVSEVRVRVGTPWEAICEEATTEQAELIVVGSHGYGGLDRVLGTTAARIVNHAPCSVLVVRAKSQVS